MPQSKDELLALTGVGQYVANAVLAVAFGQRQPLLDPNVIRVVTRVTGRRSTRSRPREDRELWALLASLVPAKRSADFGLALVDLGSTTCRTRRPRCYNCPLRPRCIAFATGAVEPADLSDSDI